MLKEIIVVFTITMLISTITLAQKIPSKQIEVTQHDSLATTKESVDSSTVDSVALQIWNKVCPVMGNKVDVDGPTVEYNGKLYGFCCPGCDAKFEKNPEKYSKNLSEDGTKFIGRK